MLSLLPHGGRDLANSTEPYQEEQIFTRKGGEVCLLLSAEPFTTASSLHGLHTHSAFPDKLPRIVGAGPKKCLPGPGPGLSYRKVSSSGHSFFLKIAVT